MKYLLVLLIGASLVLSCRYIGGKRVRGDGNLVVDSRQPGDFEQVESFGSFDVYVATGNEHTVKVEADGNLQQYITTEVGDGKLKISTRRGYSIRPRSSIKIYITAPQYTFLGSNGSGNIHSENKITSNDDLDLQVMGSGNIDLDIEAKSTEAEIAGSGNIFLKGVSKEFKSGIHGSGSIKAGDLKTEESSVEIAGSGDVDIYATTTLKVNIMGSGGVRYKGNAQVNSHVAGSGSVSKFD